MRRGERAMRGVALAGALLLSGLSCSPRITTAHVPTVAHAVGVVTDSAAGVVSLYDTADRVAWIALSAGVRDVPVSGVGAFEVLESGGRNMLVRGTGGESWRVEQRGQTLRVTDARGRDATPWRAGPFVIRARGLRSLVQHAQSPYRGELWITPTDSGLLVVNRVPVEDYLRGVVPLELGTRNAIDAAALQAQAIAARSYTYVRVPAEELVPRGGYQMTATVLHQVYGGVAAEHPVVDNAIAATSGLVLRYNGAVVDGPYSSSCGGRTALPSDAWRGGRAVGYLQSVSDVNPRTGQAFCDISPTHEWEASFSESLLRQAVVRHLGTRGASGTTAPIVQSISVGQRSTTGRVATLIVRTDRGSITLTGPDARSAFRDARGASLLSTYFEVDRETRVGQRVSGVVLKGKGHGHGVGMCQWGAIGRARAGHDVRAILRHYYPGTVVGFAD